MLRHYFEPHYIYLDFCVYSVIGSAILAVGGLFIFLQFISLIGPAYPILLNFAAIFTSGVGLFLIHKANDFLDFTKDW